jgi:hypothetical protein
LGVTGFTLQKHVFLGIKFLFLVLVGYVDGCMSRWQRHATCLVLSV